MRPSSSPLTRLLETAILVLLVSALSFLVSNQDQLAAHEVEESHAQLDKLQGN